MIGDVLIEVLNYFQIKPAIISFMGRRCLAESGLPVMCKRQWSSIFPRLTKTKQLRPYLKSTWGQQGSQAQETKQ